MFFTPRLEVLLTVKAVLDQVVYSLLIDHFYMQNCFFSSLVHVILLFINLPVEAIVKVHYKLSVVLSIFAVSPN